MNQIDRYTLLHHRPACDHKKELAVFRPRFGVGGNTRTAGLHPFQKTAPVRLLGYALLALIEVRWQAQTSCQRARVHWQHEAGAGGFRTSQ